MTTAAADGPSWAGFTKDEIDTLVEEHRELYDEVAPLARDTNEKVTLLVNDMYGELHPTAVNPLAREGGWVQELRAIKLDLENGIVVERRWSTAQWAFFGSVGASFIAACGSVVVALIGG